MDISQTREHTQFPLGRNGNKPMHGKIAHGNNAAACNNANNIIHFGAIVTISEEGKKAFITHKEAMKDPDLAAKIENIDKSFQQLFAEQEQRRQLWAEEVNNDDFMEKLARGDYAILNDTGLMLKQDIEFLKTILSEEQHTELEQLLKQQQEQQSADIMAKHYGKVLGYSHTPYLENAEKSIFEALNGKMTDEEAKQVARELGKMITNSYDIIIGYDPPDMETQAANREAARDLAKYIAENYFDDPKEAKAFMDNINKYIGYSELLDKGYVPSFTLDSSGLYCEPTEPKISSKLSDEALEAWRAEFDAKANAAQSIIDKVKQITDFSGNEKWNFIMNLLQPAMKGV